MYSQNTKISNYNEIMQKLKHIFFSNFSKDLIRI